MDVNYEPVDTELRTLYGLKLEQKRNTAVIDKKMFDTVMTDKSKQVRDQLTFFTIELHLI